MLPDPRETVSAPSERSLTNFRHATAWGGRCKTVSVAWKFWTDQTRWKPEFNDSIVEWWERREVFHVRQKKLYWLRFGVTWYWRVQTEPHERMNHVT
jgi:hypothetical protein